MSTGNPPAGYYADPSIPGYIRYWDGNEWVAGTSRPAPDEVAEQVTDQAPASSPADAVPADSGTWQPEPAGGSSPAAQPDPLAQSSGRSRSGARGYAQGPATAAAQQPQAQPQPYAQAPSQGRHTQAEVPQRVAQQYAEPVGRQAAQQYAQVPQQPQQFAPTPAPAPVAAPAVQPVPVHTPAAAPVPEPATEQVPESVATMIVPSAFAPSQRTGTYRLPGHINNPFAGLPGSSGFAAAAQQEEDGEAETTVVELATPGSRILGRIIDLGIAAIFSAPVTVTLLLIAHRHDHQYVLKLDAQATTTYTTLGMDGVGIALWAGALLAFMIVSIVYEGYRLSRGGQTLGKRLAGVRVVRMPSGSPLGKGSAGTRRALLFWILAIIPLVDIVTLGGVLWGRPYRQGVHERATSTATIKA